MTGALEWEGEVGRNWAAEWRRTDRSFVALTGRLLERIAAVPGRMIVDIGCGAGELALAIAGARPGARVVGIDVSPELVAVAAERGRDLPNCAFALADAASWTPQGDAPDLYVSRHGVMFFADPVAAFAHLAGIAGKGARLVFSCFRAADENPWASEVVRLLGSARAEPGGADAPGPFAFADPRRVEAVLAGGGWSGVALERIDFAYRVGEGADAVGDALGFVGHIGPAVRALATMSGAERGAARERLRRLFEANCAQGEVVFPAAVWLVSARRR